jgi:hypothetical protein
LPEFNVGAADTAVPRRLRIRPMPIGRPDEMAAAVAYLATITPHTSPERPSASTAD